MMDIVFIAQSGELEIMAALLAASIRKHGSPELTLHVIEPTPPSVYGEVSPRVKAFLESLDVNWYNFPNPISDDYKIFNKLNAFRIRARHSHILFLDSDTLVRKSLDGLKPFLNYPFAAKAANKQRFSVREADWAAVYGALDLPLPTLRLPAWDSGEWAPPYLNAGVLLVRAELNFSQTWIEVTRRLHFDATLPIKNRNTVQISLPVALAVDAIPFALLDNRFNFCLSKGWLSRRPRWPEEQAAIVHYFRPKGLLAEPVFAGELVELVAAFDLEDILALSTTWSKVLRKARKQFQAGQARPGVPKTTLFQQPRQPMPALHRSKQYRMIALFPGVVPGDLKLNGGGFPPVCWEEIQAEGQGPWYSSTGAATSVIWPEPVQHWCRFLEALAGTCGDQVFLAVVLHPLEAVARWKESSLWNWLEGLTREPFPLLESGTVGSALAEGVSRLISLRHAVQRAAGLWTLLVAPVLNHLDCVRILPVAGAAGHWPAGPTDASSHPQHASDRQYAFAKRLEPNEIEWIRAICSAHAAALGFNVYPETKPITAGEN